MGRPRGRSWLEPRHCCKLSSKIATPVRVTRSGTERLISAKPLQLSWLKPLHWLILSQATAVVVCRLASS
jgi:hypothetical protein